jgi:hypothetical protein
MCININEVFIDRVANAVSFFLGHVSCLEGLTRF